MLNTRKCLGRGKLELSSENLSPDHSVAKSPLDE